MVIVYQILFLRIMATAVNEASGFISDKFSLGSKYINTCSIHKLHVKHKLPLALFDLTYYVRQTRQ